MEFRCAASSRWADRMFFILSAAAISFVVSICCFAKGLPILPRGPAVAISEVTKSLAETGSFAPKSFQETYKAALEYSRIKQGDVWQDVFSIDQEGRLRPKHSLFSAVAAVPFYLLFGTFGFWILQQLFLLWLFSSMYLITEAIAERGLPWSTLLATCLFSQTLFYSYDFSYELHACSLLIGGLYILRRSPFAGGVVMALSLFVRPSHLLMVVPLTLAARTNGCNRGVFNALIGVVFVALFFLLTNYLLYGDPFSMSYSRLPGFNNGTMFISPHPVGFDVNVFLSGWSEKLFSSQGLLPYNLSLAALPFVLVSLWRREWATEFRWFQILCLLVGAGYTLYIFSYPMWATTFYGNRYLLPAIYLYLVPFIVFLGRFEVRLLSRSARC